MAEEQSNEIRTLKMQVAKLQLESKLRRNLASEIDPAVPQGCVYERLTKNAPNKLIHEELPISLNIEQNNPAQIPFSLQAHLERCKREYLEFMRHMEVR